MSPRELDALLIRKNEGEAARLAALRSDIWNAITIISGIEKRFEPRDFLGRNTAKDDMRSFVEEWERGQVRQPDVDTLAAFKKAVGAKAPTLDRIDALKAQHQHHRNGWRRDGSEIHHRSP
jgi:hypothetical protein